MNTPSYKLLLVEKPEAWHLYHQLRKEILFDSKAVTYDANHPDDRTPGNLPMLFYRGNDLLGTLRIDSRPEENRAIFRTVAVVPEVQGEGHGRALLETAEAFVKKQGIREVCLNARLSAKPFYEKCGYRACVWSTDEQVNACQQFVKWLQ